MHVDVVLKCPDQDDWVAMTLVEPGGGTRSLGYLPPEVFARVAESLKPLLARIPDEGHESVAVVDAWGHFVHWVDVVAEFDA